MKKSLLILSVLMMGATVFATTSAKAGQDMTYGMDSELFLQPYVDKELKEVSGDIVLDAGCGSAMCSIKAAKNGAKVCAIASKTGMIEQAKMAIANAGVESQVSICQGDVEKLPYQAEMFDRAFLVNGGSAIPATMQIISQDHFQITGLGAHFRELSRVMKEGGRLLVTAPASYDIVFTTGNQTHKDVYKEIQSVLSEIGGSEDSEIITSHLSKLDQVLRATFVRRDGQLKLVTDERGLCVGEKIWCKLPQGVISSYYHSEEEYLVAMKNAGLTCEEIKRPCFFGNVQYDRWRSAQKDGEAGLGSAYINHHPFTIFYVVKGA